MSSFSVDRKGKSKSSSGSSFEVPSCPLEISTTTELDDDDSEAPLSRSSSSSFARRSWTELKVDSNIPSGEEEAANGEMANVTLTGSQKSQGREEHSDGTCNNVVDLLEVSHEHTQAEPELADDNDSTLGAEGSLKVEAQRNFLKLAVTVLVILIALMRIYAIHWGAGETDSANQTDKISSEQLRADLDKQMMQRWELERELAATKERLDAERTRRDEVEQELRRAHERLETDLRGRIMLQRELEKAKAELTEAEAKMAEAELRADQKWMGSGFGELTKMYRKAKEREWLSGNLKETSEWWVPLYWRVVRVTFYKEG